jgi:hypothetical protein
MGKDECVFCVRFKLGFHSETDPRLEALRSFSRLVKIGT